MKIQGFEDYSIYKQQFCSPDLLKMTYFNYIINTN